MTTPIFDARRQNGQLVFLCDRCGQTHIHDAVDGLQTSHCTRTSSFRFGELWENYDIRGIETVPGFLTSEECLAAQRLTDIAHNLIVNVRDYLEKADVDPLSDAFARLDKAEQAMRELREFRVNNMNPFERIVREAELGLDEDEEE